VSEDVKRVVYVRVRVLDRVGEFFELEVEGFLVVVIQYEYDYLDGVLMVDYFGVLKKKIVQCKM
jgi:N-formylmethionyl-tRNA deformylase